MATIHYMPQGSDDWHDIRLGVVTASIVTKVLSNGKGRAELLAAKVKEIETGVKEEHFVSNAMMDGVEREPYACWRFQWLYRKEGYHVGFVSLNERIGCSPDLMIGEDGLAEFKAPQVNTMEKYHDNPQKLVSAYNKQVQMQLWVTGRKWCYLFAYNPECVDDYVCELIHRDEKVIKVIQAGVEQFVAELIELTKIF